MTANPQPWDLAPDLTLERLRAVAKAIQDGRRAAYGALRDLNGDIRWARGCLGYQLACNNIVGLAGQTDWLKIVEAPLALVFSIGRVPIRFFSGDVDNPNDNVMRNRQSEMKARQLWLGFVQPPLGLDSINMFRVAVQTDEEGETLAVQLGAYSEQGELIRSWSIPPSNALSIVTPITSDLPSPVDLPPPAVDDRLDIATGDNHEGDDD